LAVALSKSIQNGTDQLVNQEGHIEDLHCDLDLGYHVGEYHYSSGNASDR
jgi:bacterioferritin (cytochrome b1)